MRFRILLLVLLCTSNFLAAQTIPLTADHLTTDTDGVRFGTFKGTNTLQITDDSRVRLNDVRFRTGTIEYRFHPANSNFSGVYFRTDGAGNGEHFYLRPFAAGRPTQPGALQYAPEFNGVSMWDVFQRYEANGVIHSDDWNTVKLEVSEQQMRVTVNGVTSLYIPELLGPGDGDRLELTGNGHYADLKISQTPPANLPDFPAPDVTRHDPRYLTDWEVTPVQPLPRGQEVWEGILPDSTANWQPIAPDRYGIVNLTRRYPDNPPTSRNDRRVAWLRTTLTADADALRTMDLGFNDEVWVFLNGQLLYIDQNRYALRSQKAPGGRVHLGNAMVDLSLQAGENELLIALGHEFFGWGMVARLR